jgi:hypothetical protein
MQRAADAIGAVMQLTGLRFRISDEFGQLLRRQLRVDREHRPRRGHQGDRRDVLGRIVWIALLLERQNRQFGRPDHQRVTVRIGVNQHVGAELRHGAGTIVDDDRLPQLLAQTLADQTADNVHQRTRGRRDDQVDRARRIIVRARNKRREDKQNGKAKMPDDDPAQHCGSQ